MKKLFVGVVLLCSTAAHAGIARLVCVGNSTEQMHKLNVDTDERTVVYDGIKMYYVKSGTDDKGVTFNFFRSEGEKSVAVASTKNPPTIGFIEFTGNPRTDYGQCSPK